jgi:hypothetical protein
MLVDASLQAKEVAIELRRLNAADRKNTSDESTGASLEER